MGYQVMFLLVWTLIFVSCNVDNKNLQVNGKFFLIETANNSNDNPKNEDYTADNSNDNPKNEDYKAGCEDRDKEQCPEYSHMCSHQIVSNMCRKTCGFCQGNPNCADKDKKQCPKYKDHCSHNTVANMCQKTCGFC